MAGERPKERADAARNRRAILDATAALLAEQGADAVTMDRVAAAAGVGKGTIFHRFGSRAGLLLELIGEHAYALRDAVVQGPPPLGPGAPPGERLLAFFAAFTDMVVDNAELMLAYQAMPPHADAEQLHVFWSEHVTALLEQVRPDLDAQMVGALLMAPLGAELLPRLARAGEKQRVRAAMLQVVASVLPG
ncbi:TetR/AcrR family transcriptional regulator [Nocardia sp. alder85J]|uniref:TetR/AcrR family transcriptional regulator n=1 Tax=Nocardia sp. alder85J TaxID=2862949 RepID=UPI001CD52FA9|nr:TetR/AcrR family transcriptional regulator [Nocardia sp. alder85J]MCX4091196.1 helix-turn-helix domain containing protein [Nocardia sp. alder85J]